MCMRNSISSELQLRALNYATIFPTLSFQEQRELMEHILAEVETSRQEKDWLVFRILKHIDPKFDPTGELEKKFLGEE
jgi:hypothetical protein